MQVKEAMEALSLNQAKGENVPAGKSPVQIEYREFESEEQLPTIMKLIESELSEPYSIYTYRYFLHNWQNLCILV